MWLCMVLVWLPGMISLVPLMILYLVVALFFGPGLRLMGVCCGVSRAGRFLFLGGKR